MVGNPLNIFQCVYDRFKVLFLLRFTANCTYTDRFFTGRGVYDICHRTHGKE